MHIGIEIGGTKQQVFCSSRLQTPFPLVDRTTIELGVQATADAIRSALKGSLCQFEKRHGKIESIGVGYGGPIDIQTGRIICSHHISGWDGFSLRDWLSDSFGAVTTVDNDANVAGLAEAVLGAGKDYDNVFYMNIGSGIGGALIQGRQIFHGAKPGEAEIGHLRLSKDGTIMETRCSGWAINRRMRELAAQKPTSLFSQKVHQYQGREACALEVLLDTNNSTAVNLFGQITDDLAFALSHVSHLFHPDIVILGGGLSLLGDKLSTPIQERIGNYIMQAHQPGPSITTAKLKQDVVPLGGLVLSQQALMARR